MNYYQMKRKHEKELTDFEGNEYILYINPVNPQDKWAYDESGEEVSNRKLEEIISCKNGEDGLEMIPCPYCDGTGYCEKCDNKRYLTIRLGNGAFISEKIME